MGFTATGASEKGEETDELGTVLGAAVGVTTTGWLVVEGVLDEDGTVVFVMG